MCFGTLHHKPGPVSGSGLWCLALALPHLLTEALLHDHVPGVLAPDVGEVPCLSTVKFEV